MKLCKDCKHVVPAEHFTNGPILSFFFGEDKKMWEFAKCGRTRKMQSDVDYITGAKKEFEVMHYCCVERRYGCGPDAENFEPKE